ncbi:hypothetical protein EOD40_11645 [Flavobacterium sufflavum]|uniref:Sugar-binding protein n=1 Tax=Flavobacterium sufflavum TaxID=1921138 RepID=A0A437KTF4_9FLAO|nr:hypothetical protein [Flavobacterium sufflavum]RVT75405.1 hypothetical protein EOD40_11645 [Flavobacterium sufflavum]
MKITKFLLVLLLSLNSNLFAQIYKTYNTKKSDPEYLEKEINIRSKNNISESFEYTHQVNSSKDSILKSHKTYSRNGLLLTSVVFSSEQDTINYLSNRYESDQLIESNIWLKRGKAFDFNYTTNYKYDEKGNNIETKQIDLNKNIVYRRIEYDNNNFKKALYTKRSDKTDFSLTQEYFYSKKNKLIKTKTYSSNEKLFEEEIYQYNKIGNLIGNYLIFNGKKSTTHFYSYDKNNNQTESGFKSLDVYKTKYEYDKNNNIVKICDLKNDTITSIRTITYKKFE